MSIEVRDESVEVPGGSVFVRRWHPHSSQLAPIILLHDSLGSVELWRDFPAALAAATGRPLIAYDRLGFGRSAPRRARPLARFIAEEAESAFPALQRALGLRQFALLGHSVGGAMALMIAATHGAGCEAVITEAAQAWVEPRTLAGIRAAKQQFEDPAQLAKLARWHGDKAGWVLDAWTEVWLSAEFLPWSLDAHLAQVSCPVLALHGDLDEYGSVAFPRRITGGVGGRAELAILEGCGHVPHRERAQEVIDRITSFLAPGGAH